MKLVTEGVLVLASSKGLIEEYQNKDFNYDFPEGLNNLLDEHKIIALTTEKGDDLLIDIKQNVDLPTTNFDNEINQCLSFQPKDELLILSHANFTQICRFNKGNYKHYRWPVKKIEGFDKGTYHFNIAVEDVSGEFEKYNAYYKVTITINKADNSKMTNKVVGLI